MNVYTNRRLTEKVEPMHAPYAVGVELGNLYYGGGGKVGINEKSGAISMDYTTIEGKKMNVKCKFRPEERKAFLETIRRLNLKAGYPVFE